MANTDKKPAKPAPAPSKQAQAPGEKEVEQELDEDTLDQVNGGIDGSAAWTASGIRKR
jgi:hypothetical protein